MLVDAPEHLFKVHIDGVVSKGVVHHVRAALNAKVDAVCNDHRGYEKVAQTVDQCKRQRQKIDEHRQPVDLRIRRRHANSR